MRNTPESSILALKKSRDLIAALRISQELPSAYAEQLIQAEHLCEAGLQELQPHANALEMANLQSVILRQVTQLGVLEEIARGVIDIMQQANASPYVKPLSELRSIANGGGDGLCLLEELQSYFEYYGVSKEPQSPEVPEMPFTPLNESGVV